jgi:hypothetical protein
MNKDEYFFTSDLGLSSYLSLYFSVEFLNKNNPNKVIFNFLKTPELTRSVEAYWKRKVQVNPQDYFSAIKNIKTRLYESR